MPLGGAVQHVEELSRDDRALLDDVLVDRRQVRQRRAGQFQVVEPGQAHVPRHVQALLAQGLQGPERRQVVAGDDRVQVAAALQEPAQGVVGGVVPEHPFEDELLVHRDPVVSQLLPEDPLPFHRVHLARLAAQQDGTADPALLDQVMHERPHRRLAVTHDPRTRERRVGDGARRHPQGGHQGHDRGLGVGVDQRGEDHAARGAEPEDPAQRRRRRDVRAALEVDDERQPDRFEHRPGAGPEPGPVLVLLRGDEQHERSGRVRHVRAPCPPRSACVSARTLSRSAPGRSRLSDPPTPGMPRSVVDPHTVSGTTPDVVRTTTSEPGC